MTKNDVSPHRNEETDSPRTIALGRTAPLFETFSSERQKFCQDEMVPWPRANTNVRKTQQMRMRSSERAIFSLEVWWAMADPHMSYILLSQLTKISLYDNE